MQINYCCPYWGSEKDKPADFIDKVLSSGYDGVEVLLPAASTPFTEAFLKKLSTVRETKPDFFLILQQLTAPENESVDSYIKKMSRSLMDLTDLKPGFINTHTGKDYYSFDDNCRVIEAALNISHKTGIRILHETHRGRFSFHAASLIPYLRQFPELELTGDFSHFCTVSESLLEDQEDIIGKIIPHVSHIHARVGHTQGPQVTDPFLPEWEPQLIRFEGWWQQIINDKIKSGVQMMTITPEFGPAPYMPLAPFTQEPLGNQWQINCNMMQRLRSTLAT